MPSLGNHEPLLDAERVYGRLRLAMNQIETTLPLPLRDARINTLRRQVAGDIDSAGMLMLNRVLGLPTTERAIGDGLRYAADGVELLSVEARIFQAAKLLERVV